MEKLPKRAGISLNPEHYQDILDTQPKLAWLEASPEYYLGLGGAPHYYLEKLGGLYPLGFNSHVLSIGSAESVNETMLNDIRRLLEIYQPSCFTELLSWTRWQGTCFKRPLPLPYTDEAVDQVSLNIKAVQQALGRRILVENPAQYLAMPAQELSEAEFFHELVRATGCGMCLNVTNLYLSCLNLDRDAFKAFAEYPLAAIQQLRIGGQRSLNLTNNDLLLVDAANGEFAKPVWRLYHTILNGLPSAPTTAVNWTEQLQSLTALNDIAQQADDILFEVFPVNNRGARS